MSKKNRHSGSGFDDFLEREGILDEVELVAAKRAAAMMIQFLMKESKITKVEMARQMHTSRPQLDRLLDPTNTSVTLKTLSEAAAVFDYRINIEFLPSNKKRKKIAKAIKVKPKKKKRTKKTNVTKKRRKASA